MLPLVMQIARGAMANLGQPIALVHYEGKSKSNDFPDDLLLVDFRSSSLPVDATHASFDQGKWRGEERRV